MISSCVINLAAEKGRALREAYRVPRPGGRFAAPNIGVRGEVPQGVRRSVELWAGRIPGALEESESERLPLAVGLEHADIGPTRIHSVDDARAFLSGTGLDVDSVASWIDGRFMSAFIGAKKPASCFLIGDRVFVA